MLGRGNPWPETIDVATEAAASFTDVTGATGVGDVDNDQRAEWVTLAAGTITALRMEYQLAHGGNRHHDNARRTRSRAP